MASTTQGDYPLATVQFSRLTKRGVMLGLSLPQLVILAVAVLTVVAGLYTGGGMGLAWTSPVWGIATLLAVIPAGGRKLIEWVPIVARWTFRTYLGQLIYRRRVIKPRPAGTLALPGDAAPADPDSAAQSGGLGTSGLCADPAWPGRCATHYGRAPVISG